MHGLPFPNLQLDRTVVLARIVNADDFDHARRIRVVDDSDEALSALGVPVRHE